MSLLDIAKIFGLPPEIADALPELAASAPGLIADAKKTLELAGNIVVNVETKFAQLDRIEHKLDILGRAVIQLLEEKQNGRELESDAANDGSTSNSSAALTVARNGNE